MLRFFIRLCYSLTLFLLFFWLFLTLQLLVLSPKESPSPPPVSAVTSESTALPTQTLPQIAPPMYYLCLSEGRVVVYGCDSSGKPDELLEQTDIYSSLLPQIDRQKLGEGIFLHRQEELQALLEDLGG